MNYIKVTVSSNQDSLYELGDMVSSITCGVEIDDPLEIRELTAGLVARWDYIDESLLTAPAKKPAVRFYVTDDGDGQKMLNDVRLLISGLDKEYFGELTISLEGVDSSDWENKWKDFFFPFPVGEKLYVCPSWRDPGDEAGSRKILTIDPGMAFGTGGHATTRMCLEEIGCMELGGKTVIDAGCGSGILCIGAGLMGAERGVFCDIDPQAVKSAEENLAINKVSNMVGFSGDMTQKAMFDQIMAHGPFDLTVANITADVLIALSRYLVSFTKEGGTILLSGILSTRKTEVTDCFDALGLKKACERESAGWTMLKYLK